MLNKRSILTNRIKLFTLEEVGFKLLQGRDTVLVSLGFGVADALRRRAVQLDYNEHAYHTRLHVGVYA